MTPSLRSHPNHPQQPVSPPYTRNVRGNRYGSGHWLRHSLAGSPLLQTESGSLLFGTAGPPRAAPHPVSRRRSCLRLLSRCSSRDDSDFHWLISYMCVRTSGVSMTAGSWCPHSVSIPRLRRFSRLLIPSISRRSLVTTTRHSPPPHHAVAANLEKRFILHTSSF